MEAELHGFLIPLQNGFGILEMILNSLKNKMLDFDIQKQIETIERGH
jgi:hypothetical protein